MKERRDKGESGFSLPETLVASAIVAAMLGATLNAVQDNARAARVNEERRAALLVAQSQLAAARVTLPDRLASLEGRSGDIGWTVRIEPYRGALANPPLDRITVTAGTGPTDRPLVEISTLRMAGT